MNTLKATMRSIDLIPEVWGSLLHIQSDEDILFLGQETIREMILYWKSFDAKFLTSEDLRLDRRRIARLSALQLRAVKKPLLPWYRPDGYFAIGDEVVVYSEVGFTTGVVISVEDATGVIDVQVCSKDASIESVISHVLFLPEVIHKWEFDHFLRDYDFMKIWVNSVPPGMSGFDQFELEEAFVWHALQRCAGEPL